MADRSGHGTTTRHSGEWTDRADTTERRGTDLLGAIMDWEAGELSNADTLELFSALVESGQAWTLQGAYGRQATALIEAGFLKRTGEVTELGRTVHE